MDKIKIIGGKRLEGKIYISGAKNAALPLICASLLTDETVTLTNMPMLSDIKAMNVLLEQLGTKIDAFDDFVDGHPTKTYSYRTKEATSLVAPYDYVRKMRASYYVLGPLLARYGNASFHCPVAVPSVPDRWIFICHRWNKWARILKLKTDIFTPRWTNALRGRISSFRWFPLALPAMS